MDNSRKTANRLQVRQAFRLGPLMNLNERGFSPWGMLSSMATIRQKQSSYAITISTFQQHRHFQRTANADLFIATLFQHRDKGRFQLHGFVVMPDHVHVLITPAIDQSTAKCIQFIKGGYSFAARERSAGAVWHSGYHEHRIRDIEDFDNQLRYIANNPSRKQYDNHPYVHTRYEARIDPVPDYLLHNETLTVTQKLTYPRG